jgi:hypothetical protein
MEMTGYHSSSGAVPARAKAGDRRLRKARLGAVSLMLIAGCWAALDTAVHAADVSGVWASDARNCDKIFVKKGNGVFLSDDADIYGSGFVIEGRKIRGKAANCDIKTMKEDGPIVHMLATCATDIMFSNVQLSVKVVDQNRIVRLFPGMEDIQMPYERCTLP